MVSRIEIAEVVSFRLRVPRGAIERLVDSLRGELQLSLNQENDELVLEHGTGESFLRFRPSHDEAVLTEVAICNDERGLFFQRVLGDLVSRYEGDLHVRLVWNDSDRNTHGGFAEAIVQRGRSNYPGFSRTAQALRNTLVAASADVSGGDPFSSEPAELPFETSKAGSELADEIEQLLEKGRQYFAEYQRLKSEHAG